MSERPTPGEAAWDVVEEAGPRQPGREFSERFFDGCMKVIQAERDYYEARIAELESEKTHLAEQLTAVIARRDIPRDRVREVLSRSLLGRAALKELGINPEDKP